MKTALERAQTRNQDAASEITKLALKRDKAIDALIRAETRYRKAIRTVARTQRRYDALREQARAVRAARAARKAESQEQPADAGQDIIDALGV